MFTYRFFIGKISLIIENLAQFVKNTKKLNTFAYN